jgi:predicted MFS family arabinose efflux permease
MTEEQRGISPTQWGIISLIAAVQFVNILDFVMVMPLGPDLAKALLIDEAHLSYVNGAYTMAAAVAGLAGSFFLDRFDRKKALLVALLGLAFGTLAGSFALGLKSLMFARALAGVFGGPATSLSISIISDVVAPKFRGRAMGAVMGAFSLAAIVGVPMGLWLAEKFAWQAPFVAVASLGLALVVGIFFMLPNFAPLRSNQPHSTLQQMRELLVTPLVRRSYLTTALVMLAGFILIPNIAAHVQLNWGFPREKLKFAYLFGGLASLISTSIGGYVVDKFGSFRVSSVATCLVLPVMFFFFYLPPNGANVHWVYVAFILFMMANGLRNVSYQTLTTKVPDPALRARFQSLQSAVQHTASAGAAFLGAPFLSTQLNAKGEAIALHGIDSLAFIAMGLSACIPLMVLMVQRGILARGASQVPAVSAAST